MNLLYLVGNGTDMNLGMKSGYSQFYNHLETSNHEILKENILFKLIKKDKKCWSYFEKMIGVLSCYNDNAEELIDNINKLDFKFSEDELNKIIANFSDKEFFLNFDEDLLIDSIEIFSNLFQEYLISQEKKIIGKIEEGISSENWKETFIYFWFKDTYSPIDNDWNDNPNNIFLKELTEELTMLYNGVPKTYERTLEINYQILNFNYTNIVEKYFKSVKDWEEALSAEWEKIIKENISQFSNVKIEISFTLKHIHEDLDNGMFLGVDNINQLDSDFIKDEFNRNAIIKPDRIIVLDRMDDMLTDKFTIYIIKCG